LTAADTESNSRSEKPTNLKFLASVLSLSITPIVVFFQSAAVMSPWGEGTRG